MKHGNTYRVGWIPKKFAVKGKTLELNVFDEWISGKWEVVLVGTVWLDGVYAEVREMDYKKQREASDI